MAIYDARKAPPLNRILPRQPHQKVWTLQTPRSTLAPNVERRENTNMPPYESESSDEGEDYTETNVLLGYATKDATGDAISHIGGAPVCTSLHNCKQSIY